MNAQKLLTVKQAAERLNLDPSRIRQLILAGRIRGIQYGGRFNPWLITAAEVSRFKRLKRPTGYHGHRKRRHEPTV